MFLGSTLRLVKESGGKRRWATAERLSTRAAAASSSRRQQRGMADPESGEANGDATSLYYVVTSTRGMHDPNLARRAHADRPPRLRRQEVPRQRVTRAPPRARLRNPRPVPPRHSSADGPER